MGSTWAAPRSLGAGAALATTEHRWLRSALLAATPMPAAWGRGGRAGQQHVEDARSPRGFLHVAGPANGPRLGVKRGWGVCGGARTGHVCTDVGRSTRGRGTRTDGREAGRGPDWAGGEAQKPKEGPALRRQERGPQASRGKGLGSGLGLAPWGRWGPGLESGEPSGCLRGWRGH